MRLRTFAIAAAAAVTLTLFSTQTSQAHERGCGPVVVSPGFGNSYSTYRPTVYGSYYAPAVSYYQPYAIGYAPVYDSFSIGYSRPGFSISYSTGTPAYYGATPVYAGYRGYYRR